MKAMRFIKGSTLAAIATAGAALSIGSAQAQDTIKVGILHSLSGTMAISETTLKDTMLMLIAEQNAKGGLLGKKLEPVVVDPASDWPLFAEKARELIEVQKVAAVFGCWTSVSRKSVLPVFEELNSLLFYPVQYEGEESSKNVFYTGAAPNQQAIPAVDYLMKDLGVQRWVLALAGRPAAAFALLRHRFRTGIVENGGAALEHLLQVRPQGLSDLDESCPVILARPALAGQAIMQGTSRLRPSESARCACAGDARGPSATPSARWSASTRRRSWDRWRSAGRPTCGAAG